MHLFEKSIWEWIGKDWLCWLGYVIYVVLFLFF